MSIGIGGFFGSIVRYLCSTTFNRILISDFPVGTLFVNVIGCFLIGLLINSRFIESTTSPINEFVIIGLLGGFTTFSAFGLETYNFIKDGAVVSAISYILSSIIFGLIAIYISSKFSGNF